MTGRLPLYVNELSPVQKNQIAFFLSSLLAILTLAVAGVGVYTYQNLNSVVNQLKTEANPNLNLLLLKEVIVSLSGMEDDIKSYELTGDQTYLNRYSQRTNDIKLYLDSLKRMNWYDVEIVLFSDSLTTLTDTKVSLLNQLPLLDSHSMDGVIERLSERLDELPDPLNSDLVEMDTVIRPVITLNENISEPSETGEDKKGLFQKIFSKKKKEDTPEKVYSEVVSQDTSLYLKNVDSLLEWRKKRYQAILEQEIQQLQRQSKIQEAMKKRQELEVAQEHQEVQSIITHIITRLEERELKKLKANTLKAQHLADETSEQVFLFSILTTILLIVTLIVTWNYIIKNREYQRVLSKAKNEAEDLAKTKEQFLANMSHEIRTPMNAISGFTNQLLKTELTFSQKEYLQIISKSSNHLLHLLNDILDFSKLQAKKLKLEKTVFDLPGLLKDVLTLLSSDAKNKNVKLRCSFRGLPKWVIGDQYRLRQIVLNLVHNGIKFTDKGEVGLYVSTQSKNKKRILLTIRVKDTGIGISKDKQQQIFKEFEQAGSASFSKGTGLGLSITKKLIALHRGTIDLESTVGEGTEIRITLPYELAMEEDLKILKPEMAEYNLEGLSILIADDEPYNRKLLTTILGSKRIVLEECDNGKRALELLMSKKYDLALLDLKMPEMSGWEVARKIRETKGDKSAIPLIALTATINQEEYKKGFEVGFNRVLRKPFNENELLALIAGETGRPKVDSLQPTESSQELDPGYSLEGLKRMGDDFFVTDMLQTFIESATAGLVLLEKYILEKDWDHLANEAHKIVAPARHLEAQVLVRHLKELESRAQMEDESLVPEDLAPIKEQLNALVSQLKHHVEQV